MRIHKIQLPNGEYVELPDNYIKTEPVDVSAGRCYEIDCIPNRTKELLRKYEVNANDSI